MALPYATWTTAADAEAWNQRVLQNVGFVKEGLLRQRWVAKGEARDVEVYGLLSYEWNEDRGT